MSMSVLLLRAKRYASFMRLFVQNVLLKLTSGLDLRIFRVALFYDTNVTNKCQYARFEQYD